MGVSVSDDLDILNQSLEVFGLDDETLLSITEISNLNVNEVYKKLKIKNDIANPMKKNPRLYRARIEEDLITILSVNLREDSLGHIELVDCFKPEHAPAIDEIMKKTISSLSVPPSNVFLQNPGLIHHFYNILWTNDFLKRNIEAGAPVVIIKDLTNRLRGDISNYLDNESNIVNEDVRLLRRKKMEEEPDELHGWILPARLPPSPGRETMIDGVGRHMDGVLQIITGWKTIPVHDKHPHYHTFIKRLDPHLLQIYQDCMINQDQR